MTGAPVRRSEISAAASPTDWRPARVGLFSKGNCLLSLSAGIAVLVGGVAFASTGEASALALLAERPLASVQIAAGVALCTGLLAVPAVRALSRLLVRREVRFDDDAVQILRHTPLGISALSVPVKDYRGIAHHIRASLSGLVHEVVLVHPDAAMSVTLVSAPHVTQAALDEYKSLFNLPEIPARAIYERHWSTQDAAAAAALSPAKA